MSKGFFRVNSTGGMVYWLLWKSSFSGDLLDVAEALRFGFLRDLWSAPQTTMGGVYLRGGIVQFGKREVTIDLDYTWAALGLEIWILFC